MLISLLPQVFGSTYLQYASSTTSSNSRMLPVFFVDLLPLPFHKCMYYLLLEAFPDQLHSFIQHVFMECLLHGRHYNGPWEYLTEQHR